eukprot:1924438-Pleurochrysis_carterae.AAC.2
MHVLVISARRFAQYSTGYVAFGSTATWLTKKLRSSASGCRTAIVFSQAQAQCATACEWKCELLRILVQSFCCYQPICNAGLIRARNIHHVFT